MTVYRDLVVTVAALIWLVIGGVWLSLILTEIPVTNGACPAHYHMNWVLGTPFCVPTK